MMARILLYLFVHGLIRSSHGHGLCTNHTHSYDPLLLTPYIEQGDIDAVRNVSRVDPQLFLNIESYSGYVTVNSEHNSLMFFWYFPSFAKPVNETPWIIWLQGGPGSSSMIGLFEEMGPFRINEFQKLESNPHTWLANHSMVFIDNPVGVGFSSTESFVREMDIYGAQMHSAVKQLVQLFPELRVAPLFVAGESYAGKYVPALAAEIHRHKNDSACNGCGINLQGLILGNAVVEPEMMSYTDQAFIRCNLLNKTQIEPLQEKINLLHQYIAAQNGSHQEAYEVLKNIMIDLKSISKHKNTNNCKISDTAMSLEIRVRTIKFLTKPEVERALHVAQCWNMNKKQSRLHMISGDFLSSARSRVEELLETYPVLSYCGQLDLLVPCYESFPRYRKFQWSKSEEFKNAEKQDILYKSTKALEITKGGGLTWVVVEDAGHKVPADKPDIARRLVTSWIRNALTPDVFDYVYGRVAVNEEDINDAELNVISDPAKIIKVKVIDELLLPDTLKKACHTSDDIDNNIVGSDNVPCVDNVKIDNGTALILTPLIEQGRIDEARNASRIDHKLILGLESYSGFLTVNSTYNSNLFFWYFPSFAKPVNETPWIIWLQGGPGASSLTGLFDEIGPFSSNSNGTLRFNPYTWLMNHSLVFIDNPVGTGYSFTEHKDGYVQDMNTYGKHLHSAVKQLVQLFPELRVAPLFVAGESYAGKYVPALGMEIHRNKDTPGMDINLKGLIIGNAYVEPEMIAQVVRPFYHFGLLEREQIEITQPLIDAFQADIAAKRSLEAKEKWNHLISIFLLLSHQTHAYNFLRDDLLVGRYITFLTKPDVKKALHVGDIKFSFVNITVNTKMAPDFLSNSKPLFEELLEHYKVLSYCGQLDQMLPCAYASERLRAWKWSSSSQFLESIRYPFIVNEKLAGYHKSGGGLTWVVVRGAGHMVPLDTPRVAQRLLARWTHGERLTRILTTIQPDVLREFIKNSTVPLNDTVTYL